MKAALILKGQAKIPDGNKLKKHGVKRLYYEANDPQVDAAFIRQIPGWGFEAGVMRDPVWNDYNDTPTQFIGRVNTDIARLTPTNPSTGTRPPLSVMLDIERHDEAYVYEALKEFDRTNLGRNYVWTMEYHQGGWFSQRLVDHINADAQCKAAPQLYYGDMSNTVDSHAAARDLYTPHGGVHDNRICFFYSLRVPIPADWDGILYLENWSLLS